MSQQRLQPIKIFNAVVATGSTVAFPCMDWRHVFLTFASSGSANFTMKFQISNSEAQPDFSASASRTNVRTYVQIKDLITNTAVDGATGITSAGTDSVRILEVNTNGQKRVGATITAWSSGTIDLTLTAKNGQ